MKLFFLFHWQSNLCRSNNVRNILRVVKLFFNECIFNNFQTRGEHVVTEADAKALAAKINATYIETSSKTRKQLKDAFDAAILAGLPVREAKRPLWKKLFCLY